MGIRQKIAEFQQNVKSYIVKKPYEYQSAKEIAVLLVKNKKNIDYYHDYFFQNYYKMLNYLYNDFNVYQLYDGANVLEEMKLTKQIINKAKRKHLKPVKLNDLQHVFIEYEKFIRFFEKKTKLEKYKDIDTTSLLLNLGNAKTMLEADTSFMTKEAA